jgi:hypothetical protein
LTRAKCATVKKGNRRHDHHRHHLRPHRRKPDLGSQPCGKRSTQSGVVLHKTAPIGRDREAPKYRVVRAVHPSNNSRHRHEPPFAVCTDSDMWQYADRAIMAGEEIVTRAWPHSSFFPLNYSAQKVLDFFNSRPKSRLPLSPCYGDSVRLSDGLNGPQPRPQSVKPQPVSSSARPDQAGFHLNRKISAA